MEQFKRWNNIVGWAVFAIAALVYLLTMEPVSSLWDCSEFIATSYKLEVGHPPGAPLFMMLARLATLFAMGNPDYVGIAVNTMNSLASAFCILFLFWTITHLARRMLTRRGEKLSAGNTVAIIGAGVVGALAYTFTDTFWFSAIEGEVYALSSMFTALVVWLMLKWEDHADEPHALRWLVLIAYLMGLSIGVHILNLLTLPALAFIYYFRKTDRVTLKGCFLTLLAGCAAVIFMNNIIIPVTVWIGASIDVFCVNWLGLPVNTGMVLFSLALIGTMGYFTWITHKKNMVVWNTILLSVTMVLIGYSSYASVSIRAAANPPMNSNNPDNPQALLSFLNRDQYGDKPLLFGPYFSAPRLSSDYEMKTAYYLDDAGKYQTADIVAGYKHDPQFIHFFPRMWDARHSEEEYKAWAAYRTKMDVQRNKDGEIIRDRQGRPVRKEVLDFGRLVRYTDEYGDPQSVVEPTFGENLRYFFSYQLNYMYWRYFLWNFVGRQNDIQAYNSALTDGNWLSGVKPIDELYLGPQDDLPREVEQNRARNTYYFLPFILGLVGLLYQLNRDQRNFSIVMILFFMTGIALVLYFNTSPGEPRERDYVYAGSFYAFSIWIGLGVMALYELLTSALKHRVASASAATLICMVVPSILAAENWDDHDRSGRYLARDIGWNYLMSTLPNSIILNYGDNDTFPLWNNQEVYGVRTDVRIMNTSYLNGEWYIDQMKTRANEAAGVPFTLPRSKYTYCNDWVPVVERIDRRVDLKEVIDFVRDDSPATKLPLDEYTKLDYIPTKRLSLPVNKDNAIAAGIVKEEDRHLMVDTINIDLKRSSIEKKDLMILDMLAHFDWKRPIYTTQPFLFQDLGLIEYVQFDGYAYRLVPIRTATDGREIGRIDVDYVLPLLRDTFRYGNLEDPDVYVDYFIQYNLRASHSREAFARVAKELLIQCSTDAEHASEKVAEAVEMLDLGLKRLPPEQIRFNYGNTIPFLEGYYTADLLGDTTAAEKGDALARKYAESLIEYMKYYARFDERLASFVADQHFEKIDEFGMLYGLLLDSGREALVKEFGDQIWSDPLLEVQSDLIMAQITRELYYRNRGDLLVPLWQQVEHRTLTSESTFRDYTTVLESYYMAGYMGNAEAVSIADAHLKRFIARDIALIDDTQNGLTDAELDALIDELYQIYALALDARRTEIVESLNDYFRSCGTPEDQLVHVQ